MLNEYYRQIYSGINSGADDNYEGFIRSPAIYFLTSLKALSFNESDYRNNINTFSATPYGSLHKFTESLISRFEKSNKFSPNDLSNFIHVVRSSIDQFHMKPLMERKLINSSVCRMAYYDKSPHPGLPRVSIIHDTELER